MAANNETGARQPVRAVAAAVRAVDERVVIHTDAVQAVISEEVTLASTGADLITLASHKFGGPKGVGLLHVRREIDVEPVLHGGGQEIGRRSGTHNVAGIVGMVAALDATVKDRDRFRNDVGAAHDAFVARLARVAPEAVMTIPAESALIQHCHFRIPGVDAETLLIRLDGIGVAGSAGSACHSGALGQSHVLAAMGIGPEQAAESVRFSFGWTSRPEDGAAAADAVAAAMEGLR
jgi:cysteine desulfurase